MDVDQKMVKWERELVSFSLPSRESFGECIRQLKAYRAEIDRLTDRLNDAYTREIKVIAEGIEQRTKDKCKKAGWRWIIEMSTDDHDFGMSHKDSFEQAIQSAEEK